ALTKGLAGGGAQYGSPSAGPAITSSINATSRTERAIGPSVANPAHPSPITGAKLIRPREGFSPTTPQQAAGTRIEPPPSVPSASKRPHKAGLRPLRRRSRAQGARRRRARARRR